MILVHIYNNIFSFIEVRGGVMNTIGHLEIPANNIERAKEFYSNLFNWEFQFVEEMNYMMFTIKNSDGIVTSGGGIPKKQNEHHSITNYINVENIETAAKRIEELGGKIKVPKSAVPGMGWFVHFSDPEGNVMALWQDDKEAK
jgi:predicted enzyme related to lactoylglutathione lyase